MKEDMKIIISPAKKMNINTDIFPVSGMPQFIEDSMILMEAIKSLTFAEAKALWKCNDKLARLNYERFQTMDPLRAQTPAVISYEGLQYQHMASVVFTDNALSYINEHLRILSGFYGLLKPFDAVTPYRLEMQAKLSVNGCKNLYDFWKDRLYQSLPDDDRVILNLASKEYAQCIEKYVTPKDQFLTVEFKQLVEEKTTNADPLRKSACYRQKGTLAKMARGEMVRFMAENQIEDLEHLKEFCALGFAFSKELSSKNKYVFIIKGGSSDAFDIV